MKLDLTTISVISDTTEILNGYRGWRVFME